MHIYLTTRVFLRTNRTNKQGEMPIYLRFTISGQRKEISTNIYTSILKWDNQLLKIKGNSEEARTKNNHLDHLKLKAWQAMTSLSSGNQTVNIDNFINIFNGKAEKARMLIPIFNEHNSKIHALCGNDYSIETYKIYERTKSHTVEFMVHQYNIKDIAIDKIDNAFIHDFDFFLRTERKCSNNTAIKYVKNLKKIIRICIANGWITKDPLLHYKTKTTTIDRIYLTQEELHKIIQKQITIERLDTVRDLFIFACYTGLAYIDVKQLTTNNIVKGIDGSYWIHTFRQKTDSPSKIPLLEIPISIIDKYKDHPKCENENTLLPILSNQRMNAYLKEIADICDINKVLTFHSARHTFATTVTLSNGVPIETVSKILGHKSIKITQHYAKITDRKLAHDMQELKNKLNITTIKRTDSKL